MPRGGRRPGAGRPSKAELRMRDLYQFAVDGPELLELDGPKLAVLQIDAKTVAAMPPELRKLYDESMRQKAMREVIVRLMNSGVTFVKAHGGKRPGAGRPKGARNKP
jgi:hypothetical protein